jgi:type IV pilus assembly protein PilC
MEFEYISIDKDGKRIKSFMKADSAAALAASLRSSGGKPLKITPMKRVQARSLIGMITWERKEVTSRELVIFTRQLGSILSAGVLLSEAIETIATDMENEHFADILKVVLFHIHGGENFSNALAYHPAAFSSYYIAIVRAGEAIGALGSTMVGLAEYMEESEKMRLKFLAAIRYPVFLLSFVFCIVSAIVLFLIPKFKGIFEGAGVKLPLLTQVVVGASEFILQHLILIGICMALIAFAVWKALEIFRTRFMIDYWLLQVPVIGKVVRKAFIARFCQTSSMLVAGGVGLITALNLSLEVVNNLYLKQIIGEVRDSVTGGSSLSEAMRSHEAMPRILVKMVAVGEKSGTLHEMLGRMGKYYDQEVDTFLNNINTLLEPIFIIIIGAVVVVVALALYLPIFQMSGAVR